TASVTGIGFSANGATASVSRTSNTATKYYVDAAITLTPGNAVNEVNQPHTFTATVTTFAPAGPTVSPGNITITSSNRATHPSTAARTCTLTVTSLPAAPTTATASVSGIGFSAGGATASVSRSSNTATKQYVDASITIAPNAINGITEPHTFTITVTAIPSGT